MRYNIHGYRQDKAIEFKLNNDELLILRHFEDFATSGRMDSFYDEGYMYYCINYDTFLKHLPILGINKVRLGDIRKFFKYLEAQAGRTEEDKMQEIIKLDIDILMVDTTVLKPLDLERPYIKRGLKHLLEKQKINQIEKSFQTSC